MLNWEKLDPRTVERTAQLIVSRETGATAIDGSGGDKGQDLRLESADGLTIFEIKSYATRVGKPRRRKVAESLTEAVRNHQPTRWVLVTPLNPTPGEHKWMTTELAAIAPGVELEWWGLAWLEGHITEADISYVEGEEYGLLKRVQQFGLEQQAALTGDVLLHRYEALSARGDDISPYWRWLHQQTPFGHVNVLSARRPDSDVLDPIQITSRFQFPEDDEESTSIREALTRFYRTGGDVTVPGRFVADLDVQAASAATERLLRRPERDTVGDLRLVSVPDTEGLPWIAELARVDADGVERAKVAVTFTRRLRGSHGQTLLGASGSGILRTSLQVEWEDPVDDDADPGAVLAAASANLSIEAVGFAGRLPDQLRRSVVLLDGQPGDRLILRDENGLEATFGHESAGDRQMRTLLHLATALDIVGQHLGRPLAVPTEALPVSDVRDLIAAARALSGQSVALSQTGFTATIRQGMLREFLDALGESARAGALFASAQALEVTLDGQPVVVTGLAYWAPKIRLANLDELTALADHSDETHEAHFETFEDGRIFLCRDVDEPDGPWTAMPQLGP